MKHNMTPRLLRHIKRLILPGLLVVGILAGVMLVQGGDTVPYKSKTNGHLTFTPSGGFKIQETGIGTHLGKFTLVGETDQNGDVWIALTAASGDQVFCVSVDAAEDLSWVELEIYDGTGRFEGATGHIAAIIAMDWPTLDYAVVASGSITTVGSNQK